MVNYYFAYFSVEKIDSYEKILNTHNLGTQMAFP